MAALKFCWTRADDAKISRISRYKMQKGALTRAPFLFRAKVVLQPIDEDKETYPHDVHEVPVPSDRFKGEVVIRFEVPAYRSREDGREHDGAHRDVETVESGKHEKRGAINPGVQG